jgi:hypothetical protein
MSLGLKEYIKRLKQSFILKRQSDTLRKRLRSASDS